MYISMMAVPYFKVVKEYVQLVIAKFSMSCLFSFLNFGLQTVYIKRYFLPFMEEIAPVTCPTLLYHP